MQRRLVVFFYRCVGTTL